jgi:ribose/xylose/arabinose/galactoside ABC-type transport system permease subunit
MTSLANLLTTLFVGLKLTNHIDWSWFWVISPVLIAFAVAVLIGAITGVLENKYK